MIDTNSGLGRYNINPTSERNSTGTSPLNPYNNIDPNQSLSWWNRFTDALGFTNHSGQLNQQYDLLSNQWESEYALSLEDRNYNSPQEQVKRMREAGLNPDLNGGQQVGNPESQLSNNESNAAMPERNDQSAEMANTMSNIGKAVQFAFSMFGGAADLTTKIASSVSSILDADTSKVGDLFDSNKDTLVSSLITSLGMSGLGDEGLLDDFLQGGSRFQNTATADGVFVNLDKKINSIINNSSLRTRKARKYAYEKFRNYIETDSFRRDVERQIGENKNTRYDSLGSSARLASFGSTGDAILSELTDIAALYYKRWKSTAFTDINLNSKRNQYANSLDVSAAAQATNDMSALTSHNSKLQQAQTGFEKTVLDKLYKDYKDNKPGAGLLLFGYQLMKSMSVSVGQTTGKFGPTSHSFVGF